MTQSNRKHRWAALVAITLLSTWAGLGCQGKPQETTPATSTDTLAAAPAVVDTVAQATGYVCPMHADQTAAGPAKCGVCGMDMVDAKTVAQDTTKATM